MLFCGETCWVLRLFDLLAVLTKWAGLPPLQTEHKLLIA